MAATATRAFLTPWVKKRAHERAINPQAVAETGFDGRVSRRDPERARVHGPAEASVTQVREGDITARVARGRPEEHTDVLSEAVAAATRRLGFDVDKILVTTHTSALIYAEQGLSSGRQANIAMGGPTHELRVLAGRDRGEIFAPRWVAWLSFTYDSPQLTRLTAHELLLAVTIDIEEP